MLELNPFTLMVFYLIPFLIASARGFDMPVAFLLANLVLGWTIVGSFVLLYAAMAGAGETMIFSDLGVVTTTAENGPALTRSLLSGLAATNPDVIVIELGDGLLGAYGVEAILTDPAIREAFTAVVLCANDPVAAWGGVRILREQYDIEPALVTGPATDNAVGIDQIRERLSLLAVNALTNGVALGDAVADALGVRQVEQGAS